MFWWIIFVKDAFCCGIIQFGTERVGMPRSVATVETIVYKRTQSGDRKIVFNEEISRFRNVLLKYLNS